MFLQKIVNKMLVADNNICYLDDAYNNKAISILEDRNLIIFTENK